MKVKGTIVMTAVLLSAVLGMAQTASAGYFTDRQQRQKYRIQEGIASGQITPREAQILYRDQQLMRQLKRYFLADGDLSGKERRILKDRLERSSHRIHRYKDNQRRASPPCTGISGDGHFAWR